MLISSLYTKELQSITDTSCQALVYFNPTHPLYAGHFPGQPITPGVCLVLVATELLSEAVGVPMRLASARQIKFLQMHTPEHSLRFELLWTEEASHLRGRISIFRDEICIAKIDAQFERI